MTILNHDLCCCGLKEIGNISDAPNAEQALKDIVKHAAARYNEDAELITYNWRWQDNFAIAVFTQVVVMNRPYCQYGEQFAKFITENKLGTVSEWTDVIGVFNPNSGYHIRLWAWVPDHEAVKKWLFTKLGKAEAEIPLKEQLKFRDHAWSVTTPTITYNWFSTGAS